MKILLVDDHALFRDGVALLLKELDPAVQVWHASNVAEALAAIDDLLRHVDIGHRRRRIARGMVVERPT